MTTTTTVNPDPPEGMTIPACTPTSDPAYWRMVEPCEDTCHHPVHAFGNPERLRHLIPTADAVVFEHEPLRDPANLLPAILALTEGTPSHVEDH